MPIDEHVPIDFDPRWLAVLQQVKDQFGKETQYGKSVVPDRDQ